MRRECRESFPCHRGLAIPTWHTCRDGCRDHLLTVSLEVGARENVPGIPGECATRTFASLVRGPKVRILVTADGSNFCGCDGADLIIPDSGEGDNWPLFPVRELVMGDTGDANEYIDYKLGPLVCKQGMAIHATIVMYRNK